MADVTHTRYLSQEGPNKNDQSNCDPPEDVIVVTDK
jgi:hypothetical protein